MNPFSFSRLFFLGVFSITSLSLVANERKSVRVLTYNAWYGFTKKADRKPRWLRYVRSLQSDIVALQELNRYTEEKLAADGKFWGHKHSALLKRDGFPTGITSRYPIENIRRVNEGYHHGMLTCKTGGIQVYVIHLHPGHWEIRHQEIDLLLKTVASHQASEPVLLIGDFNTFSVRDQAHYEQNPDMIPFFRRLDIRWKSNRNLRNDRLDYSHLQKIERAGYQDIIADRRERFLGTFPTKLRLDEDNGPSRRLDYIFANKVLTEKCIKARYLINSKTDILSDHYPAISEFEIE